MRPILVFALLCLTVIAPPLFAQGRGFRFNQDNVPGWTLMTSQERAAHQEAMQKLKTYDECKTYTAAFREKMEARAKEQGKSFRGPPNFVCDQLKASGAIK